MTLRIPTSEQRFVLEHVVGLRDLITSNVYEHLSEGLADAIIEGAASFAENEFAPLNRLGDTQGAKWAHGQVRMPAGYKEAYASFVENGWATVSAPAGIGGQGLPHIFGSLVFEDIGTANMGFSLISMLTAGAIEALLAHGSEEQMDIWLPKLVTGEWSGTMNLTEPQAGSDVGALRTSATPAGDGLFRINGQKIFITFGDHDLTENIVHLVLARLPDAPGGTKGISLFLVPKFRLDADGAPTIDNHVRCVSIEHKLGIHASPTCVMAFGEDGDCLGELIGAENAGMRAMFTMMNNARINVGGQGVQIAERARQLAHAYARERMQSPRADGSSLGNAVPIVEHPDVRRMLLRMNALTQGARALYYYAAGQIDRAHWGDNQAAARVDLLTPLVKSYCTDVGCEVASLGIQVHGGMGFIEETGAAQHYRDARILPIYEGTNGIQAADLVGRKLAGDRGIALRALLAEIRAEAGDQSNLMILADEVEDVASWMLNRPVNDRLSGSYPFLRMVAVLVSGWLMARQGRIARSMEQDPGANWTFLAGKRAAAAFTGDCIVPEAIGLSASAMVGAALFYGDLTEEALAE
jgi:alkylation response protein AidB-like acyl-CoA dehydrogenase